ncbi:MAG: hypothetical protein ACREQY_05940, partial [Candidatus Binatia bacterium]
LLVTFGFGGGASAQTICQFGGTSSFSPNLTGQPSSGPIAFRFGGMLSGCQGSSATTFEGATVSTASGTIAEGGSCSAAIYDVDEFTITDAFGAELCRGSIPESQGVAAAGIATAVPQEIDCGARGSGFAAFQLQFLVPPDPTIIEKCGAEGLSQLSFSGLFESQP